MNQKSEKKNKLEEKIDNLANHEVNPPSDMWARIEEKLQDSDDSIRKLDMPDSDVKAS